MARGQSQVARGESEFRLGYSPKIQQSLLLPLREMRYFPASADGLNCKHGKFLAERGAGIFNGKAQCATCHVPPLYTEPGWNMHTAAEIGIDDFQSSRSPDNHYRTTPLAGLWSRQKGGFYHDGRFQTLEEVIDHYATPLNFTLTPQEKSDLVEYLKSI